jgi:hypothetical protein
MNGGLFSNSAVFGFEYNSLFEWLKIVNLLYQNIGRNGLLCSTKPSATQHAYMTSTHA